LSKAKCRKFFRSFASQSRLNFTEADVRWEFNGPHKACRQLNGKILTSQGKLFSFDKKLLKNATRCSAIAHQRVRRQILLLYLDLRSLPPAQPSASSQRGKVAVGKGQSD